MAIAGSFAAWAVYRLVSMGASAESRRRLLAAALAGYCAINLSALLAAIEFGIQPMLFHDANGVPLYAPYPLHIAIPAMMAGHLTIAGAAEAAMTAGLFSYLRRHEPALVGATAQSSAPLPMRTVFGAMALLLLLTPLGILAGGAAWGEWAPRDFADQSARASIAAASGSVAAPAAAPSGLARISGLWTAPIPAYAPHFVKSAAFGYLLSAMFGVGAILSLAWLVQRVAFRTTRRPEQ
jgi:cobalt/nickel transport system permease protein